MSILSAEIRDPSGAGVAGGYGLPDVGAGDRTQDL